MVIFFANFSAEKILVLKHMSRDFRSKRTTVFFQFGLFVGNDCFLTEIHFSGCFSQICSKMEIACTHSSSFQIRCTLNQRVHTKLALLDLSKN